MNESAIRIRDPAAKDEEAWRKLWFDYCTFYQTNLPENVTARTWQRILDPASPIFARFAIVNDAVAGFCINVLHEGTWAVGPICYLEDLFVDAGFRGRGLGRALIADVLDRARSNGWSRLYWHTRMDNPARRLYDEFAKADDFVRYRMLLG